MKRGGQPKTLVSSSSGAWPEASDTVAERLADWQQNLSDQVSLFLYFCWITFVAFYVSFILKNNSPSDIGLPPDPIDEASIMPELQHQGSSSGLLSANSGGASATSASDNSAIGLASSFKDKVKIEKKPGSSESQPDQKKEVMVEVGGKKKPTGGKSNKRSTQTANQVRVVDDRIHLKS